MLAPSWPSASQQEPSWRSATCFASRLKKVSSQIFNHYIIINYAFGTPPQKPQVSPQKRPPVLFWSNWSNLLIGFLNDNKFNQIPKFAHPISDPTLSNSPKESLNLSKSPYLTPLYLFRNRLQREQEWTGVRLGSSATLWLLRPHSQRPHALCHLPTHSASHCSRHLRHATLQEDHVYLDGAHTHLSHRLLHLLAPDSGLGRFGGHWGD